MSNVSQACSEPNIIRVISAWKVNKRQEALYEKIAAEKYRDIDFSRAKRGAVVKPEPGKTKVSREELALYGIVQPLAPLTAVVV